MYAIDNEEERVQLLMYEFIWCVQNVGTEEN